MKPQVGFLFIATLALALAPARLAAQDSLVHATIDSGTLVRFHPLSGPPTRGRLLQPLSPSSTIVVFCRYPALPCTNLADSTTLVRLPVDGLERVELQTGTRWATGAWIGGAIGVTLGGLASALGHGLCESTDCGPPVAVEAFISGVFVGLIGALIGSGSPTWAPAP